MMAAVNGGGEDEKAFSFGGSQALFQLSPLGWRPALNFWLARELCDRRTDVTDG